MRRKIITKFEDIREIANKIGKIKGIKAIYLFGSYATNKNHALSDIDICVIGDLTEKAESEVMGFVSDNLDISIFNRLPIYIKIRVFKEGKLLILKDKEYVDLIKIRTLREYLDFKPAINKFCMETLKCTI